MEQNDVGPDLRRRGDLRGEVMRCGRKPAAGLLILGALFVSASWATAADWPMWRYDANRSAASPHGLPAEMHLQWVRHLPALQPAWVDKRFHFDASYEPIVVGKSMFVASSHNDSITAYHTDTGAEIWRFYTNGPVRFAPVANNGKLYCGCDDGVLYCLDAKTGKLLWKFCGRPNRKVMGNERLISVWPVRGGPVMAGGKLYFTAGIWPFEGVFLYSLDVDKSVGAARPEHTVTVLNTRSTCIPVKWDLGSVDVESPSPQGYLAAVRNTLLLPCGRAFPRFVNIATGKVEEMSLKARQVYIYPPADSFVAGIDGRFFLFGMIYDHPKGLLVAQRAQRPVVTKETVYAAQRNAVVALDLRNPKLVTKKMGYPTKECQTEEFPTLWELKLGLARLWIKAGERLYGSRYNRVQAIELPSAPGKQPSASWRAQVKGTPSAMLAADNKLFVVTRDGSVHCFGGNKVTPKEYALPEKTPASANDGWAQKADVILKQAGAKDGYCLAFGIGSGRLIEEVAVRSEFQVIAVEPDSEKANKLRRRLDDAGLYGSRVIVQTGDPLNFGLPPYLASLVISEDLDAAGLGRGRQFAEKLFFSLRPYGGTACLSLPADKHEAFQKWVTEAKLPRAEVKRAGELTLVTRAGALPGSADWTHEYGNPGNTLMSADTLVKPPLGLLWYGGPAESSRFYYLRHNQGPSAIIVDGRMFLQGLGFLAAVDVYTGRLLWERRKLTKERTPARRSWAGYPTGNHFAVVSDAAYITYPQVCLRLDPATGRTLSQFRLPDETHEWGRTVICRDKLITLGFRVALEMDPRRKRKVKKAVPVEILAMDRTTGVVKWTQKPKKAFPYFAVGNNRVFCIDANVKAPYDDGMRIKAADPEKAVTAFDLGSGRTLWTQPIDFVATWTAYSEEHDVLVTSNGKKIAAFRGADGKTLWTVRKARRDFAGHQESVHDRVLIWRGLVIDQRGPGFAYDLKTGEQKMGRDVATGKETPWRFARPVHYGKLNREIAVHYCGYAIANRHLLLYRTGPASYVDLAKGGTASLEGFRPGCRNSLIPADGVLNAPMFAHGCRCGYSIFTALGLIHTPEAGKFQVLEGPKITLPGP